MAGGTSETIIIMRHGYRADTAGQLWLHSVTRPWDPPLATQGWKEAWKAGLSLADSIDTPDVIFSSPYSRCLQTASAVLKAFGLPYDRLAVEKGLSESYDWYNAVRYVKSDDITSRGRYKNMGDWFFCCRQQMTDMSKSRNLIWRLASCTSMAKILKDSVFDYWNDPVSKRKNIREFGKFPDFEMYVNIGVNDGLAERRCRYVRAFNRCIRTLNHTTPRKKHKVAVIVSHMAGVDTLYQHLLQASPAKIETAGFFVVRRDNGGSFKLVADRVGG